MEHITNRDVIKATENCENEESGAIYVVARVVESSLRETNSSIEYTTVKESSILLHVYYT